MQRQKSILFGIMLFVSLLLIPLSVGATDTVKVVRVAFDKALPPFSSVDQNGEVSGFNVDLMTEIAKLQGFELQFFPLEWEDAVDRLKSGNIDVVLGMKYSSYYELQFDFTESFFTMSDVLLVPKTDKQIFTLNQLKGKVVAVQRANTSMDILENVRRVEMLVSFNQPHALENLILGRADAYLGNRWTAEYVLRKADRQDDFEARTGLINPTDYAFAVRKGNYELLGELNEGLAALYRNGTYTKLYSRYFEPYSPHVTEFWRKLVVGLILIISIALIVLVMGFVWNKRLKEEVRKHTSALADSLAFQRKVLDNTESAIFSLDPRGTITLINQVAREMLGIGEEAVGSNVLSFLPQLPLELTLSGETRNQVEGEFQLADGSGRIFHYYLAAFTNRMGQQVGWILSLQDRTEQKRWQAGLIAQEKMRALGQLVAGIAHELRNPLTAIKAFVELLPKKLDEPRFRTELLQYVPEEVERMNRILEDLLDYSRSRPMQMQWVNLREIVGSVTGLLAKRFSNEQIEVNIEISDSLYIHADRGCLKQVFINLVLNAIDAMSKVKEKKLLFRTLWEKQEYIRLSVSDTGEGIDNLENLFQPFYTTKSKGIGLGLYLSQRIIREHGGFIEVESAKGQGTTFHLLFTSSSLKEGDPSKPKEGEYAEPVNY